MPKGRNKRTLEESLEWFFSKIEKTDSGCWEWQGYKTRGGYGMMMRMPAHRWIYNVVVKELPPSRHIVVDHLCRNRGCVNTDHLEAVTQKENVRRGVGPAAGNTRKTHCPKNHPYDKENTKFTHRAGRIERYCHKCKQIRWQVKKAELLTERALKK